MSGTLPAGPYTLDYHHATDYTTAVRYALGTNTKSITIQIPVGVLWCAIAFGDVTIVAEEDSVGNGGTSTDSSTEGFVIDQARPDAATHVSVITGAAGTKMIVKERTP